jgi:hypothetical protein
MFMLAVPMVLSGFTHLWNPIGFPSIHVDEGSYYMDRAFNLLSGHGPQKDDAKYDHPYFGWLFLAGIFKVLGYPESLNIESGNVKSIENVYLVPRIIMGLLAILDTFFVFKIAERRYNRNIAFIAALLFAVMPFGWMIRRVLLESIQLPLILSSILFSLYSISSRNSYNNSIFFVSISGILLGLAIFTKIPAVTLIPLIGFLIYKEGAAIPWDKGKTQLKKLGLWFVPVIGIPLIWPAYAIYNGEFDIWMSGVLWQTNRDGTPLFGALENFYNADPVLFLLGIVGLSYALVVKRDIFLMLLSIPLLAFLYFIGFVSYWHLVPFLPVFCIAASVLILDLTNRIVREEKMRKLFLTSLTSAICIFGLVSTTLLITTSLNSFHFEAVAFASKQITDAKGENKITIIGSHRYFWLIPYLFDKEHQNDYKNLFSKSNITNQKVLIIADNAFNDRISSSNDENFKQIKKIYDQTRTAGVFGDNDFILYDKTKYPYTNLKYNTMPGRIEIRIN